MIPFHIVCPEVARRETRSIRTAPSPDLPADEYAFLELYCEDPQCDCRRVMFEVLSRAQAGQTMAYIAFGWEPAAFYERWSAMPRDLAREMARETTAGALDQLNSQSPVAPGLLALFRNVLATDPDYVARLKRHYELFGELWRTAQSRRSKVPGANDPARVVERRLQHRPVCRCIFCPPCRFYG